MCREEASEGEIRERRQKGKTERRREEMRGAKQSGKGHCSDFQARFGELGGGKKAMIDGFSP